MKKIGFSGTLDPITNGHMWVIGEAREIADEVVVFLSENSAKQPKFSAEQRKDIIARSCAERGWGNVQVMIVKSDYTARVAKRHGVDYLIRGIRTTADFDYENLIQQTNVDVIGGAKTMFVMPPRDLGSVSSSFVKALEGPVGWNWTMKKFVPPPAYQEWIMSWLRKEWEGLWRYAKADAAAVAHADQWFERLTGSGAYGGAQRQYHNLDHLVHGLAEIRTWAANVGPSARDANLVRAAFWFHDAHYSHAVSGALSNEEESAQLWLKSGLDADMADDVALLIRATDHFQSAAVSHPLKQTMLSVDLAILGQDEEVYSHYAQGIREEYRHVPADRYPVLRGQVLTYLRQKALDGTLFGDAFFAEQYNALAIANMGRELRALGQ
ncbi:pantetheine-phosphate adenylyltransferase [Pseudoduganella namucuonensis]|uniref:Phosphopantetheine adenylyltransferase n=1 Tax=Pseudoduganella namucuonensis TaxID=1035707 RepID=A0A1I7M351_9BURK|nr:pantetheine-phosphate adenylyltransferase [Pseudoduganella namucuonensis]SFV16374.1 Phosphopantetheine adenylyltransferase [Pseudoduganella namucuonensis]